MYPNAPAGYPPAYGTQQQGAPAMAPYGPQAAASHMPAPNPYAGYPPGGVPQQQPFYGGAQYQPQQQQQQQHQQQQQQHPGHGAQNRVVVVDPRFCLPQQTVLIMQEHLGAYRNDNFTITDAAGRPFFTLAAAPFSIGGKRQLLDAANMPVVAMEKKLMSLRGTWRLERAADGARLAEVKPSLASLSPSIKVYLNDGDKEPDFTIKGDFRSKKFVISQCLPGRGDTLIASVKKESRFASSTAFLMSAMTDAQKYFLTIEPGVDAAFVTALATLCDEIFNDSAS